MIIINIIYCILFIGAVLFELEIVIDDLQGSSIKEKAVCLLQYTAIFAVLAIFGYGLYLAMRL